MGNELTGYPIYHCEKKLRCKWKCFALTSEGYAFGEIDKTSAWRKAHDEYCGGKFIQEIVVAENALSLSYAAGQADQKEKELGLSEVLIRGQEISKLKSELIKIEAQLAEAKKQGARELAEWVNKHIGLWNHECDWRIKLKELGL